jgi:2-methylcitrate dehydratase
MTIVEDLARFVSSTSFTDISKQSVNQLKIRVLDSLGCAIGALNSPPILLLKELEGEFGGGSLCTVVGETTKTAPDRAAFYNGALVRYLDFNDSFLAKGETCHPSDNVAPVLAAAEYADASGKDFLVSLAVAYQVQCRLSEVAPVRSKGFDHVTQGTYAVAAGASRALGLDSTRTANAIAISGTSLNALRVTRTGKLSNWKGLAYPFMSFGAVNASFLARVGITGPLEVFEGNKGFMDSISGRFQIDWSKENLELVTKTILKKYNSEIHSQSAIESILKLRNNKGLAYENVESIEVRIFDVAYNIIGGGEEGEKKNVQTKEEADHSLPYILAVALIDGEVTPKQYTLERITSRDVQTLLQKINVKPDKDYSSKFPNAMPCDILVHTKDGRTLSERTDDYEGFFTRPMSWDKALEKFQMLFSSSAHLKSTNLRSDIPKAIADLENRKTKELTQLLQRVK